MRSQKIKGNLMLLITALIWGTAFVAQSSAMENVPPITFMMMRQILGGLVLIPVILLFRRSPVPDRKTLWIGGTCCGICLFVASILQQYGILYSTTAKAGFITTLYVVVVPLMRVFLGKRPSPIVWFCVLISVAGFYLLCMGGGDFRLQTGDLLLLLCAVCFSVHILVIDHFSPQTDGVKMSCIQFFVCGAIGLVCMLLFETPDVQSVKAAWLPIAYAGVLSSGIAYTLQVVAQKYTDPVSASLICSLEAVFAALSGYICWRLGWIGNGNISVREGVGCLLVFIAVILVQIPIPKRRKQ